MAIWSTPLTDTEVRAAYNLGNDATLTYNAANTGVPLAVFARGPGGRGGTSDGKAWAYTTGLTGRAGDVVSNHTAVVLDGSGNGVVIAPQAE